VTDPEETMPNSTTGSIDDSEPRHLAPDDAGERPLIDRAVSRTIMHSVG